MLPLASVFLLGIGLAVSVMGLMSNTASPADRSTFVGSPPLVGIVSPRASDPGVTQDVERFARHRGVPYQVPVDPGARAPVLPDPWFACPTPSSGRHRERANRDGHCDAHLLTRYARVYLLDAAAAAKGYSWAGPGHGETRPNLWLHALENVGGASPNASPVSSSINE
jgi:hypothetical protein